jgi:peptidoglycan/LPS O-acetylase OafA/YrhL
MKRNKTLDGLRGVAAILVLIAHFGSELSPTFLHTMVYELNIGQIGVIVFFLVSGMIIPTSIAHGPRTFWIRRVFRLYPLYWLNLALRGGTAFALLINATMLQELVGVGSIIDIAWTLTIEMLFYISATLLRRFSPVRVCVAFAVLAFIVDFWFPFAPSWLTYLTICWCGASLRELPPRRAMLLALCVLLLACGPRFIVYERSHVYARVLGFALIGAALWRGGFVRWLAPIGTISYSLYLMHPLVYPLPPLLWLPTTFGIAVLCYIAIERPAIALGRRLTPSVQLQSSPSLVPR